MDDQESLGSWVPILKHHEARATASLTFFFSQDSHHVSIVVAEDPELLQLEARVAASLKKERRTG